MEMVEGEGKVQCFAARFGAELDALVDSERVEV